MAARSSAAVQTPTPPPQLPPSAPGAKTDGPRPASLHLLPSSLHSPTGWRGADRSLSDARRGAPLPSLRATTPSTGADAADGGEHVSPSASAADPASQLLGSPSCRGPQPPPSSSAGSKRSKRTKHSDARSATCPLDQRIPARLVAASMFKFLAGLGTLSVPKAAVDLGVAGFVWVNAFFTILSSLGCHLFARTLDLLGREDVNAAELGEAALGRVGYVLSFATVYLDNWGAVVAYWKALSNTLHDVLDDRRIVGEDPRPSGLSILTNPKFLTVLLAAVTMPLVMYRRLGTLSWVMHMGNASMVIFIVAVIVNAFTEENDGLSNMPVAPMNFDAVLAMTVIAYSYDCQINIIFMYRALDKPVGGKASAMTRASSSAIAGYMAVVLVVGYSACSAFAQPADWDAPPADAAAGSGSAHQGVKSNILDNLSFGFVAVKLFVVLSGIPCIPLLCFENVALMQDHCLQQWSARTSNIVGSALMVVTTAFAAAVLPNLYAVLAYLGATTAMAMITILPPLYYLAMVWRTYHPPAGGAGGDGAGRDPDARAVPPYPPLWERAAAVCCLLFGCVAIPFGVWVTITKQ